MKTPDVIIADIARRLGRTWNSTVAAEVLAEKSAEHRTGAAPTSWPHSFTLGQPTSTELAAGFGALAELGREWRKWGRQNQLTVNEVPRRVHGATQVLPKEVVVPTVDAAAAVAGDGWPQRLRASRARLAALVERYPHLAANREELPPAQVEPGANLDEPSGLSVTLVPSLARLLKSVEPLSELNFDLLCRAADWFVRNGPAGGLTPRQLQIAGLQSKWLNKRHAIVAQLAGLPDLGLADPHPARLHLTYLDPDYRRADGRLHDCASVGDAYQPPYDVKVVVISENKDTAVAFPEVPGGVSVEGVGRGGGTAATFDWLTSAPLIVYWGDIDADGLEILDGFRAAGVNAHSILMDEHTYEAWAEWGTDLDKNDDLIAGRQPRTTNTLTSEERDLYLRLCGADPRGPRRLEQERIPLAHAKSALDEVACRKLALGPLETSANTPGERRPRSEPGPITSSSLRPQQ